MVKLGVPPSHRVTAAAAESSEPPICTIYTGDGDGDAIEVKLDKEDADIAPSNATAGWGDDPVGCSVAYPGINAPLPNGADMITWGAALQAAWGPRALGLFYETYGKSQTTHKQQQQQQAAAEPVVPSLSLAAVPEASACPSLAPDGNAVSALEAGSSQQQQQQQRQGARQGQEVVSTAAVTQGASNAEVGGAVAGTPGTLSGVHKGNGVASVMQQGDRSR